MLDVREATDADVFAVMSHPAIWDAISDDDHEGPTMDFVEQTSGWIRLAGYVDETLIGVILLHPYEDGEMIHVNILPGFRREFGHKFAANALEHAASPTYAEIPDNFQNIQTFSEKFGFERIGNTESEGMKNGQKYQLGLYKRVL